MAEEPKPPGDRTNAAPDDYVGTDPFARYLLQRLEQAQERSAAVALPKQRFDWTINTGNVLVLLSILVASIVAYGGWTQSTTQMQEAIKTNARDIQSNTEADRQRTALYAPRIETMEKIVQSMTGRLDNQGDSLIELRRSVMELVKVSSEMHESLAIMKMQMDRDRDHNAAAR